MPRRASWAAAAKPTGPPPMTTTCDEMFMGSSSFDRRWTIDDDRRSSILYSSTIVNRSDWSDVDHLMAERHRPAGVVGRDGPGPAGPSIDVGDAMVAAVVDDDVAWPDLVSADGGHGCRSLHVGSLL